MSRRMVRRINSGAMLEVTEYNVPSRVADTAAYDPEKQRRERFPDEAAYLRFKTEISRRNHYRWFMANFSPESCYGTLTFDDEHEVHTFKEAKRVRANIRRVLQYACPDAVFFIYMGRGKTTSRIHFHIVSQGLPEEVIKEKWKYGTVKRIVQLRKHCTYDGVDCGPDYRGLANYCFDHWTAEVGGHRWMMTKNAIRPEYEEPEDAEEPLSENHLPEVPEGYKLMEVESTKYGYIRFRYIKMPQEKKKKPIKVRVRKLKKRKAGKPVKKT